MNKFLILGIIISFVSIIFSPTFSFGTTLDPVSISPWSCPPPLLGAPAPETGFGVAGDRLYIRMVDSQGNDVEIWCIKGWLGLRYYQVEISFPNGDRTVLSTCELSMGKNKFLLTFNGTSDWVTAPSGSKVVNIDGVLEFFKHDNDNFWSDIHTTYNFTSGEAIRIDTKKVYTVDTEREKIVDTTKKIINRSSPPSSIFSWTEEFSDMPDDETTVCTALKQSETGFVHTDILQVNVENSIKTFLLYYPEMIGIDEITTNTETKSLQVFFSEKFQEGRYLSISIPRDLIDHSEKESFTVFDDTKKQILFQENTTQNYRTLNMDVPSSSTSLEIIGTELFKKLPPQSENIFKLIPPKKQFSLRISPEKILCNEGLELVFKPSSASPACVTPETAQKLLERGWMPQPILKKV